MTATLRRPANIAVLACAFAALTVAACRPFVKPTLPGETDLEVSAVELVPASGDGELALDWAPLLQLLSVRPDIFIIAGQPWNPYRAAEDRRRIAMFWQNHGYFDVQVEMPETEVDETERSVKVTWRIAEGPRYRLRKLDVVGAPEAHRAAIMAHLAQREGDPVELTPWRIQRHAMADVLREAGHMRAEVYHRMWIDRDAKVVDETYYIDPGPKSVIGEIKVLGNQRIPASLVIERSGLRPGDPLDLTTHIKRELDLADTGSFQNIRIDADTGTEFQTETASWESWIPPDTGGILRPGQVSEGGALVPRDLPPAVDVTLTVVEAPSTQVAIDAGVNLDPERVDPYLGARLVLRDVFGPFHHLTLQGNVGYGFRWRGDVDEPLGVYGNARAAWTHPGVFGRVGDLRLTASFDDTLQVGYNWRTARVAAGVRWLIERGFFFDVEPSLRWDTGVGLGAIPDATAEALGLSQRSDNLAGELRLQLVHDTRNDPVEALDGHLIALRASLAPVGTATWFGAAVDLRAFVRLSQDLGLAFRAFGEQVHALGLAEDGGVPVGARAYGGGAFGMRGFNTRRLARYGEVCGGAASDGGCRAVPLGAASLFEAAAELRWLPYRQQFGAIAFVDAGAAGSEANPFEDGVEVAAGLGLRARLWHLTLSLDLAYRLTADTVLSGADRFTGFVRIGEAF